MAQKGKPSYTDLVYEVLRSAGKPLAFQEIFDEVNRRQPVTTRNPKGTIRNALTQSRQMISLGGGRYGYLPFLLEGCLFRLPFTEKKPANHPMVYSEEVRDALWPSFLEIAKRKNRRPARVRIPTEEEVELPLEFLGPGVWGSPMPEILRRYLVENYAGAGDSLLIRVLDAEAGLYEARLEPGRRRDEAAVARRNRELAEGAYQYLRKSQSVEVPLWDLVPAMVARGLYRSDVAPDPLEAVLKADPRFVGSRFDTWMLAEREMESYQMPGMIGLRERLREELLGAAPGAEGIELGAAAALPSRESLERSLRDVGAILQEKDFDSIEEANAYLQEVLARGGPPRRRPGTALEEAQEVMYDAWEARGPERVRLARKALQISPDCADAYVMLAEETARTAEEARDLYARGVAAGERALGKEMFEEGAGHFWGILETRPYMRARLGLAQALWELGKRREAIDHLWEMLRLNPNDNQGARDLLLAWLLERGEDTAVKRLLDLYPEDWSAVWLYGRALHAFEVQGDTKASRTQLAEAMEENPHVPSYLLGRKPLPRRLPELMGIGEESEAVVCAAELGLVWRNTPGALRWLQERSEAERRGRAA